LNFFEILWNFWKFCRSSAVILKYDKTVIASHFGQYYGLLQKEWRLPKIEIGWLIKVLRNGCFHNGPVICPRLSHNGPRKVVLALGVASGQYYLPWAIMTNRGHVTGPLWKHSFINTILMGLSRWLSRIQKIKKNSIFRDWVCRNMMFLESCTLIVYWSFTPVWNWLIWSRKSWTCTVFSHDVIYSVRIT
jgi:hypothetical protein